MDYNKLRQELFNSLRDCYYSNPVSNFSYFFHGEMKMLNYLDTSSEEFATPSQLCGILYVSSARVAVALKATEKKGFIRREQSPYDKRSVRVFLTDEGREYIHEKQRVLNQHMQAMLENLGEHDAAEFVRITTRLLSENNTREED